VALSAGANVVRMAWAPHIEAVNIRNYARAVIMPPSCCKSLMARLKQCINVM
jgi:ribulose 1,5-bisphosphate carboxylase large subunit-like protein